MDLESRISELEKQVAALTEFAVRTGEYIHLAAKVLHDHELENRAREFSKDFDRIMGAQ